MATANGTAAKRRRLDCTDSVTVLVGPVKKRFMVYTDVITRSSDFFRAALSKELKEKKERVVRLPKVSPEMFELYLHWLYTGVIVVADPDDPDDKDFRILYSIPLAKLYVLGDFFDDVQLRNDAIDAIILLVKETNLRPDYATIIEAYEQTSDGSQLRRLITDCYAAGENSAEWFKANGSELPHDFLIDIIYRMCQSNMTAPINTRNASRCYYHDHDEAHPACEG